MSQQHASFCESAGLFFRWQLQNCVVWAVIWAQQPWRRAGLKIFACISTWVGITDQLWLCEGLCYSGFV